MTPAWNKAAIALALLATAAAQDRPPIRETIGTTSYSHSYTDYGFYQSSIKYIPGRDPIPYGILALTSVTRSGGTLYYSAVFEPSQHATIVIEPKNGALPAYQITNGIAPAPAEVTPAAFTSQPFRVENTTPPGQQHRPSTILFGSANSYPAPIPTLAFYQQVLPQKQPPGEIESDIGPFVQRGNTIWFATTFYDGEGVSGIGAIGSFDIATRQYEMRYLPAIAPWSGSAILLDGDDLWIGLKHRPEGADLGGGLLRYNIATGAVETFAFHDVVFTIDRAGDAIYAGTSHGLYMLRGDRLTQLRFEPDATGRLTMIPRPIEK